jgi:hypothetical protein
MFTSFKSTFVKLSFMASAGSLALCFSLTLFAQTEPTTTDKPGAGPSVIMKHTEKSDLGAVKMAKVHFLYPHNGALVGQTFEAKFAVEGMKVAAAGPVVQGTGHFHVLIDAPAVKAGEVVPADANHIHYGKGQMEAPMKLTPGKHTLTLEFADGSHRAYGPELSQQINITVQ